MIILAQQELHLCPDVPIGGDTLGEAIGTPIGDPAPYKPEEGPTRSIRPSRKAPSGHNPGAGGMKYDQGKVDHTMLPWDALREVSRVLMYGAVKYKRDSWRTIPDAAQRYHAALLRHLEHIAAGDTHDLESGLLHWAHAATNALFCLAFAAARDVHATKERVRRATKKNEIGRSLLLPTEA